MTQSHPSSNASKPHASRQVRVDDHSGVWAAVLQKIVDASGAVKSNYDWDGFPAYEVQCVAHECSDGQPCLRFSLKGRLIVFHCRGDAKGRQCSREEIVAALQKMGVDFPKVDRSSRRAGSSVRKTTTASQSHPSSNASKPHASRQVSLYAQARSTRSCGVATLAQICDRIGSDHHRNRIQALRGMPPEQYAVEKTQLPAFTPSALLDSAKRSKETMQSHSGVVVLDFDHIDDVDAAKERSARIDHSAAVFISPSGKGVKVLVRVDPIPQDIAEHYAAFDRVVAVYEEEMGEKYPVDTSGRDPSRLCFESWDPFIFTNPLAPRVKWDPSEVETEPTQVRVDDPNDPAVIRRRMHSLARRCGVPAYAQGVQSGTDYSFLQMLQHYGAEMFSSWGEAVYIANESGLWEDVNAPFDIHLADLLKGALMKVIPKVVDDAAGKVREVYGHGDGDEVVAEFHAWLLAILLKMARSVYALKNLHMNVKELAEKDEAFADPVKAYTLSAAVPLTDGRAWSIAWNGFLDPSQLLAYRLVDMGWEVPPPNMSVLGRDDELAFFIRERYGDVLTRLSLHFLYAGKNIDLIRVPKSNWGKSTLMRLIKAAFPGMVDEARTEKLNGSSRFGEHLEKLSRMRLVFFDEIDKHEISTPAFCALADDLQFELKNQGGRGSQRMGVAVCVGQDWPNKVKTSDAAVPTRVNWAFDDDDAAEMPPEEHSLIYVRGGLSNEAIEFVRAFMLDAAYQHYTRMNEGDGVQSDEYWREQSRDHRSGPDAAARFFEERIDPLHSALDQILVHTGKGDDFVSTDDLLERVNELMDEDRTKVDVGVAVKAKFGVQRTTIRFEGSTLSVYKNLGFRVK